MLAFVHRMPCREDDSSTAKDLSKVSWKRVPVRSLIVELIKSDNHLFFSATSLKRTHGESGDLFAVVVPRSTS